MDTKKDRSIYKGILTWILLLLLWELVSHRAIVNSNLFPGPLAVVNALVIWAADGTLFRDLVASLLRVISGLLVGGLLGIAVGLVSGRIAWANNSIGSVLNSLRSVPPVALVPLAILWIGINELSKISLIAWGSFFPVWLNTHVGVSRLDQSIVWSARSLGAERFRFLWQIVLPSALPYILTGIRLSIGIAYICVFVAEMAGAYQGVGFRIATAHLVFRADLMMAGLVLLGVLGAVSDLAFRLIVRATVPWYDNKNK